MNLATKEDLPSAMLNSMPLEGLNLFIEVYNREKQAGLSDAVSFEIAWLIVKKRFVNVEGFWVAMSNDTPKLYTFEMQEDFKIVMNSETEEIVMEAVLADNTLNTDNKYFTEVELEDMATQINAFGSTLPDVDHEKLMTLIKKHGRDYDAIKAELQKEKGVFKSIKAAVDKGKLWIQAVLDKRYKNHVNKFKGLSIEATADTDVSGRLTNPKYLGFTFTNNPKLKAAKVTSIN